MKISFAIYTFLIIFISKVVLSQESTAYDLFKNCSNYKNWIESKFEETVDPQILFNMGKCQGIIQTTGKMMSTLCKERKRNVNINKRLAANLEGIRTILLVKEYVRSAASIGNLQEYGAEDLLTAILSKRWPCK